MFMTALLTYFYVVLTGSMVHQMKTMQEDEIRAYMVVDIEMLEHKAYITIKNTGKTPAKNIKIQFIPDIVAVGGFKINEKNFAKPIGYFPPNRDYRTTIDLGPNFLKPGMPREYEVELSYELGNTKKVVKESYTINLEFQAYRIFTR